MVSLGRICGILFSGDSFASVHVHVIPSQQLVCGKLMSNVRKTNKTSVPDNDYYLS